MPSQPEPRRRVREYARWAALDVGAFLLINTHFATARFLVNEHLSGWRGWLAVFLSFLPAWGFWAAVTPIVFWVSARVRMGSGRGARPIALHVGLSVVTLVLYTATQLVVQSLAAADAGLLVRVAPTRLAGFLLDYQWYWWIAFAAHAYHGGRESVARAIEAGALRAKAAELSERVVKAELDTLKAQLQPHFLFNTHNAIAGLIRSRQDTAALELLTSLSDFLRYVLDNRERDAVLFARELAFARKYLEIQQVRFQGRLEVEWTIRDHCEALRVPPLLLQPLIENAVHHGVGVGRRRSVVCVDVSRRDAQLVVEVVNSASREGVDHRGFGVGLANVTARLERLYGADYSLDLELIDAADGEARMRLRMALPLERGEDDGR